jgi:hypothetical protein
MIEATKLKIDGGQETQDFRQQHDANMKMLDTSNEIQKKEAEANNQRRMESNKFSDKTQK